jgi:hypothetical protein
MGHMRPAKTRVMIARGTYNAARSASEGFPREMEAAGAGTSAAGVSGAIEQQTQTPAGSPTASEAPAPEASQAPTVSAGGNLESE